MSGERDAAATAGPGGLVGTVGAGFGALEQLGLDSSQRTLRALHVRQPVRRRGPDLPAPRAFGT
jgi:hypothetical protein